MTGLILTIFLFASSPVYAADTKINPAPLKAPFFSTGSGVNFSGKWSLNSDKSLSEGRRTAAQGELTIRQEENSLTIERISPGRQGDVVVTEELTLDGKVKDGVISGKPTKSAVSWSADGKKMTISYLILFAKDDIRNTIEIWSLSENGKFLSIDYSSQSAKGTRKANYVYDRKQ